MAMDKGKMAIAGMMGAAEEKGEPGSGAYDADLRVALSDLASALGVTLKSPGRGVEAIKTLMDLCMRAMTDEGAAEE